jgi:hypothetical protein
MKAKAIRAKAIRAKAIRAKAFTNIFGSLKHTVEM